MEESVQNQIIRLSTLKLRPYREFIRGLLRIEEQGIVFEKDYRELRALFQGQIMIYLKKELAKVIADNLTAIGGFVGIGSENSRLREEVRTPVLAIINILMDNMGFGKKLDETFIEEMEKAEDEFFPRLFRQAIKEALDNVLVNQSDYCLFNRGEYVQEKDGEYIEFPFINHHPFGCKVMIGPFTNKVDTKILFQLYVPHYITRSPLFKPENELDWDNFVLIGIDNRELPLSVSIPLKDSYLIELELEDSYNDYISSFSLDDRNSVAPYRRNYAEVAFALGQRAKYIFLHAIVAQELMRLYDYIAKLRGLDDTYNSWEELDENGDIIPEPLY
ncbi:MAG: hypothetical protein LBI28_06640 [Treponema sp.]|jgi:hypothetical protein|nr:hypothetical protein [Treponema sp.]